MSDGMQVFKLGDLGKILMCKRVLKHETSETGEIPFFKISTFGSTPDVFIPKVLYEKYKAKYPHPKKGDILISAAGTIGKTVVYDGKPSYFQDSNIVWLAHDESKVLNSYLRYYYLTEPWSPTDGSTIKRLYNENLRSIAVTVPSIEYQRKVASVLSALDDKVALNTRINAELEAMAKLLYDYWFVQFDFPNAKGKPYKSSGGAMVYNAELKREVPAGWEVEALGDHLTIERGISYSSPEIGGQGTPMINLNSFSLDGRYKVEGVKYFNGTVQPVKHLEPGDLMIAATDVTRNAFIIGKSFLLPDIFEGPVVASTDIAKVVVGPKLNKFVLHMLFNSDYYHQYIKGFASGTLVLHLDVNGIKWFKMPIPPLDLQLDYQAIKEPIEKKLSQIMIENQELTTLRDWLLPMLMNGQVTLGEAEEKVELAMAAEGAGKYGTRSA